MTHERYVQLSGPRNIPLTLAEQAQGWHFCPEMDGLLANSNEVDGDCFCELNTRRTQAQKDYMKRARYDRT